MKKLIAQLLKFGVIGIICFGIDYGLLVVLTEWGGIDYLISGGISFSVSVVVNYLLSMHFVFVSRKDIGRGREFAAFILLSISGLLLTELLMWAGVEKLDIHYMVAKVLVTGIVMLYNFVTRKIFLEEHG